MEYIVSTNQAREAALLEELTKMQGTTAQQLAQTLFDSKLDELVLQRLERNKRDLAEVLTADVTDEVIAQAKAAIEASKPK